MKGEVHEGSLKGVRCRCMQQVPIPAWLITGGSSEWTCTHVAPQAKPQYPLQYMSSLCGVAMLVIWVLASAHSGLATGA